MTLDRKRGREDCLHSSLVKARIDRGTLEAMLAAIDDALPMFRRYFQAKARILGFEKLPWWSLFAPIGEVNKEYSFDEARDLILEHYGSFSPELAEFARGAFEKHWIDAEQRPGKRGGAFCMGVDAVRESRIMSNFDGSFDQVMTLAHELGHGFHNYCAYQAGKTPMQTNNPDPAETASIMVKPSFSTQSQDRHDRLRAGDLESQHFKRRANRRGLYSASSEKSIFREAQ